MIIFIVLAANTHVRSVRIEVMVSSVLFATLLMFPTIEDFVSHVNIPAKHASTLTLAPVKSAFIHILFTLTIRITAIFVMISSAKFVNKMILQFVTSV